jgi:hypothetical protein
MLDVVAVPATAKREHPAVQGAKRNPPSKSAGLWYIQRVDVFDSVGMDLVLVFFQ